MARPQPARTQRERTDATTAALVDAAHELFALDGYAATSLDAVVANAGMTKGALYHHFDSKRELFAAVFSREVERLVEPVSAAYAEPGGDSWAAFERGCTAFLEACLEPKTQQIVLLDAQAALGWETIRALEGRMLELMEAGIETSIADGLLAERPAKPLVSVLFGTICEGAMVVARAEDQDASQAEILDAVAALLEGLRR